MFGSRHGPLHPELAILCSAGRGVAHTILGWRFGVKVQAQSSTSGAGRGDEEKKAEEEEGGGRRRKEEKKVKI